MTLRIAPDFDLPDQAVTGTFAILAKKRVGKSNAAVVMAEEMYDAGLPWVAIDPKGDWWGVRAAGDGKAPGLSVLVFGGEHGDVPLEPAAGALVADLVVTQRITCVLDVSEMTKADQRRFLYDFATRLYATNREPLHVFCEEADDFIPQRIVSEKSKDRDVPSTAQLVRAFEILIKRGGYRGIGATLITQRSASLNNDVLTQVDSLIAMNTTGTPDRKAIKLWVDYHEAGAAAVGELPTLAPGEAWVFAPQQDLMRKIQFRRRRTFDSGATPKVGVKPQRPAQLADVNISAIREAMSEMIERAEAEDPTALQARVRELEHQLAMAKASRPEPEQVKVPVLPEEHVARLEAVADQLTQSFTGWAEHLAQAHSGADEVIEQANMLRVALRAANHPPGHLAADPPSKPDPAPVSKPAKRRAATPSPAVVSEIKLRSGARRMVEALGQMAPLRLTKSQWGTVAKLKTTGGTWSTYLSEIRRAGLVDEDAQGYTLTDAGFEYLGGRPEPMAVAELQDHYRSILRAGAAKMLDALIEAHPLGLTREALGQAAGLAISGGTFSTYLSDLTRNGLAERNLSGEIVATDIIIRGADL